MASGMRNAAKYASSSRLAPNCEPMTRRRIQPSRRLASAATVRIRLAVTRTRPVVAAMSAPGVSPSAGGSPGLTAPAARSRARPAGAPRGTRCAGRRRRGGCRPAWSGGWRARAAPGRPAGPPRPPAGAWRTSDGAYAGSCGSAIRSRRPSGRGRDAPRVRSARVRWH
jgi:hypothetical protein